MSDPASDKSEADKIKSEVVSPSGNRHSSSLYGAFQRPFGSDGLKVNSSPSSGSYCVTSAFRPPNAEHAKSACRQTPLTSSSIPPMGPYPAAATFVGYPTPGPTMPIPQPVPGMSPPLDEKPSSLLQLKSPKEEAMSPVQRKEGTVATAASSGANGGKGLTSIGSPDANSKQYTILQPAGLGSRAASAIQDIAREGVVSVTAISNTSAGANANGSNGKQSSVNNSNGVTSNGLNVIGANGTSTASVNANAINSMTSATTSTTNTSALTGLSTSAVVDQQDGPIKLNQLERQNSFDASRPGMSMSPTSLSRGKFEL